VILVGTEAETTATGAAEADEAEATAAGGGRILLFIIVVVLVVLVVVLLGAREALIVGDTIMEFTALVVAVLDIST